MIFLTSFYTEGDGKNRIILTHGTKADTLFFGQTTISEILAKFGKTKIKTIITTKGELLCPKIQLISYENLGLYFSFAWNGDEFVTETRKHIKEATCYLHDITIVEGEYCLNGICLGESVETIKKKGNEGCWGTEDLMYPDNIDSSLVYKNDSSYFSNNKAGLYLKFDVTKKPHKLIKISILETY